MKIDMSSRAVTLRLKQANELRRTCLALARSSAARKIREKHNTNELVQRTSQALGVEVRSCHKHTQNSE